MFFHIDESGNTGNNLFDKDQPVLSYGVLSSKTNIDVLGERIYNKILLKVGEDAIHANVLGVSRLTEISPLLHELHRKIKFKFDYYFIDKYSYALVKFFDSVFDAGLNEAVKWDHYWTPFRYLIIHELSLILDEELLKESWFLCMEKNIHNESVRIINLLTKINDINISSGLSDRSKEIISDALRFGIKNPLKIDFGTSDNKLISPNSVGFQFVVSSMATRLSKTLRNNASSIVVDRQVQFNESQITTLDFAVKMANGLKKASFEERQRYLMHPLHHGLSEDVLLRKKTPTKNISISKSTDSIGLQIVDVYLWIINRLISDKPLSPELTILGQNVFRHSLVDGISLEAMKHRWMNFEKQLPQLDDIPTNMTDIMKKNIQEHRQKVKGLNI